MGVALGKISVIWSALCLTHLFLKMASKLTQSQLEEFRENFEMFDEDGDGTITTQELGTVMKNLGQNPSQAELRSMISEVDEDGTGDIDFDEFCTLMARQMGLDDEEEPIAPKEAFKLFDKKGNGTIGVLAFREVLGKLSERLTKREIDNIMEEIDPDTEKSTSQISAKHLCSKKLQ